MEEAGDLNNKELGLELFFNITEDDGPDKDNKGYFFSSSIEEEAK